MAGGPCSTYTQIHTRVRAQHDLTGTWHPSIALGRIHHCSAAALDPIQIRVPEQTGFPGPSPGTLAFLPSNWYFTKQNLTFARRHNRKVLYGCLLFCPGGAVGVVYDTQGEFWHKSYPGHVLWCAAMGGRGHRALQAAESARRPQGEVAPDRTTTSQSLQSECSNPLPVAPRPDGENGCGEPRTRGPGCQVGPVTASCGQNMIHH